MTAPKRKAAGRPAPRTVTVALNGESRFTGWQCTVRADFPARVIEDFQSGDLVRILAALEAIVLEHNFPDSAGAIAEHLADVDPVWGIVEMAGAIQDGIASLPNR